MENLQEKIKKIIEDNDKHFKGVNESLLHSSEEIENLFLEMLEKRLKIYTVNFEGMYPVGNCLIITAYNQEEAEKIAYNTIRHKTEIEVIEFKLTEPEVIEYLSGDY